jgi:L-aminopeptidase/D-esterase-like protein
VAAPRSQHACSRKTTKSPDQREQQRERFYRAAASTAAAAIANALFDATGMHLRE